jgi:carbonic anhydrase
MSDRMSADSVLLSPDGALARLMEGNRRYVAGTPHHPRQTADRRQDIVAGQTPFAAVLGCADSRVPPEVIFDQGLGDLFVVRVAGNVLSECVIGSIEFAAGHLGTPLIVVLAHSHCGAVKAAAAGQRHEGRLARLLEMLVPAVGEAHRLRQESDWDERERQHGDEQLAFIDEAVRANGLLVATEMRALKPTLAPLVAAGKLKVVAAYYDLERGSVELLGHE